MAVISDIAVVLVFIKFFIDLLFVSLRGFFPSIVSLSEVRDFFSHCLYLCRNRGFSLLSNEQCVNNE